MSCKDCIYYEVCPLGLAANGETGTCLKFKNKADFVEVVRCKNCKRSRPMIFDGFRHCKRVCAVRKEDDFCSKGIPKERGEE